MQDHIPNADIPSRPEFWGAVEAMRRLDCRETQGCGLTRAAATCVPLVRIIRTVCVIVFVIMCGDTVVLSADSAAVQFNVADQQGTPVPCRIHLLDSAGKPQKAFGQPYWDDHFVCSGRVAVTVAAGTYSWEIERGPEHARASGTVKVASDEKAIVNVTLSRISTLRDEGWISGDLHVHRAVADIEPLMRAEDLHFAPVIGWWNTPASNAVTAEKTEFRFDQDRIYTTGAGEDEREGGALLYFGLSKPLDLSVETREFPSPLRFVEQAKEQNADVWIDIEKPFWWDTPTWLATGRMNSIGIANNHMNRSGMLASEAWGRPRDTQRLPDPLGNGYWSQEIYYHILNCGLRIPPSAGSASGVLKNPVGYNRMYVFLGSEPFTRDNWFAALKQGRVFVTNGPLLRGTVNSTLPGSVLKLGEQPLRVPLVFQLTSNDPVTEVQVIHNGEIIQRIPCKSKTDQRIEALVRIEQPGWLLVRAIADVDHTFRFASSAPWYIESQQGKSIVSRRSAQFFLDWVNDRIERVNANVPDVTQRDSILPWHVQARQFWQQKVEAAYGEEVIDAATLRFETWQQAQMRLANILRRFSDETVSRVAIEQLKKAATRGDMEAALEPVTLLTVSVNPESRVTIGSRRAKVSLHELRPQHFLVRVENTAGITAPLNLTAIDVSTNPPGPADWCNVKIIDSPFTSRFFSGAESEYKVVEITPRSAGLREVRIIGDAGQGTQDLGFRATADVLLDVKSKREISRE